MNLPNKLTLSRFAIAALMVLFFLTNIIDEQYRDYVAAIIFLIGSFTDFLDGYIARKWDKITVFGIFADPVADKVLISSAMISLVFLHRFSPFVAIALIGRDIIMTGFRLIAIEQGVIIPAFITGKIKTISESALVLYLFFHCDIPYIELFLTIMSILLAYFSMGRAILIYKRLFTNIR